MWWSCFIVTAWAVWPPEEPTLEGWARVEDPAHPAAVMTSESAALLQAPPEDGTPWAWEDLAVPDQVFEGGWSELPDARAREALGAIPWHRAGYRGQGVRVAVFDIQWSGVEADPTYLDAEGSADCWRHPSCEVPLEPELLRFGYERGTHGISCADIVRDVAPDASIYLVRVNGRTTFESAVRWAIRHDIDIISLSMSFFNSSFYDGTGPFARLTTELEAAGVLLVTSAGNYANNHWSAAWRDGDGDGRHDVDGGNGLPISFSQGRWPVYVQWDEYRGCGLTDLDAVVLNSSGQVVARGLDRQGPESSGCAPVERLTVEANVEGEYTLEIISRRMPSSFLEVDVLAPSGRVMLPSPRFSLADPAASPEAFVVGAVRAEGYRRNGPQGFSSWGPSRAGVPKPDVAGPDGLTVRGGNPGSFFGTSASTPAVAGALALVMSREPALSAREASDKLRAWALDDGPGVDPRGDDPQWGSGRVRLPPPDASRLGCGRGGEAGVMAWLPVWWGRRRRRQRDAAASA